MAPPAPPAPPAPLVALPFQVKTEILQSQPLVHGLAAAFGVTVFLAVGYVRGFQLTDVSAGNGNADWGPVDDVVEGFGAARFEVGLE